MYEAFYGLSEKPFNLTPDPRFLYLSEKHKEAFAHLLFGIKNRMGFVMVTGEIGTGKTTICRSLLNQLDEDVELAFVFNPLLSPVELLRTINEEFGNPSRGETVRELVVDLNRFLLEQAAAGKNCVLVIDEAQNLSPSVLEQVRLLSNLETETQKLLQIILIGQPELAQHLKLPELRQLNQRITARYHLKPLNQTETLQYIAYRLRVAGGRRKVQFTKAAVRAVYRHSKGTPRVINAICDRALLIGYTKELREITAPIVKQAAREIRGENIRAKGAFWSLLKRFLPNPTILATAVLVIILVKYFADRPFPLPNPEYTGTRVAAPLASAPSVPRHATNLNTAVASVENIQAEVSAIPKDWSDAAGPAVSETEAPQESVASHETALAGLFRAWNLALLGGYPEDDSAESIGDFARRNGFACAPLTPTLDQLIAIDLPALAVMTRDSEQEWVALVGVEGDEVRITRGVNETALVSNEEFRKAFAEQALVLWRDPQANARLLKESVRGKDVEELQRRLGSVSRLSSRPSGVYDEETARAVRQLQRETGIGVDGIAGEQVRMVLSSWLPDTPTPSLHPGIEDIANPQPSTADAGASRLSSRDLSHARATPLAAGEEAAADPPPGVLVLRRSKDAEKPAGLQHEERQNPIEARRVLAEDLPDLTLKDKLAPPKTPTHGEITPPAFGSVPLVPREPAKPGANAEES